MTRHHKSRTGAITRILAGLAAGFSMAMVQAQPQPYYYPLVQQAYANRQASAPTGRENWFGFSPDGIAMPLVLYGIYSARESIHVLAYIITNREILAALAAKAQQGVPVTVVIDYGESIAKDNSGYIRRGLAMLAASGATVCATRAFRLMHDKSMVLDGRSVQNGSINYTGSGENDNSEDATIQWNDLAEAAGFEQHFQSRFATCQPIN
jgi:phosphatidylserine/phosphatidylglycerophosphate/cardiolipin synthase-like enzyme